jgi:hypothetical protein
MPVPTIIAFIAVNPFHLAGRRELAPRLAFF